MPTNPRVTELPHDQRERNAEQRSVHQRRDDHHEWTHAQFPFATVASMRSLPSTVVRSMTITPISSRHQSDVRLTPLMPPYVTSSGPLAVNSVILASVAACVFVIPIVYAF